MVTVRSLRTGIKYKETPAGKIPTDWSAVPVEKVTSIEYGGSLPERSRSEGTIQVFGSNGVIGYHNEKLVDGPGIIVGRKGSIGVVVWSKRDFWPIDTTYFISKEQSRENLKWLYYLLSYLHLENLNTATGIPGLNRQQVSKTIIALPPLGEQRRIAEILTTIDNAIEESDKIIEKIKELKRGLMQTLLTRGIGHKKFRKTEIGSIPIEWQVCNIEKIASTEKNAIKAGPFGSALKKSIFVDKGYKVYGQEQVIPDDFSVGNYYINEETFNSLKDFAIKPDDVLISLVGTFGKVSVVPKGVERGIINPRLIKITLDFKKVLPSFIKHLMTSELMQNQMSNYTHGLTMGILNTKTIKMLVLPIPSLKEQKKITEVLTEIDAEINTEQNHKSNLESLKKSLMQVLLTGKVRVQLRQ